MSGDQSARLVAAAPAMLTALKFVRAVLNLPAAQNAPPVLAGDLRVTLDEIERTILDAEG